MTFGKFLWWNFLAGLVMAGVVLALGLLGGFAGQIKAKPGA